MKAVRCVLLGLVFAHVALVVARVPHSVFAERITEVADYRARGGVRFHLDNRHHHGAEAVKWLLAHTDASAVILWRGDALGAFEFVPPLIHPRLLLAEAHVPAYADAYFGRPIARGAPPGRGSGQIVLVGEGDGLRLEVR